MLLCSNLSRQSSHAALPSSLGMPTATAASQAAAYEALQAASCGFAPQHHQQQSAVELQSFASLSSQPGSARSAQQHCFAAAPGQPQPGSAAAMRVHAFAAPPLPQRQFSADCAPLPGTAPASFCNPFFSGGLAAGETPNPPPPMSHPASQPGSARAAFASPFDPALLAALLAAPAAAPLQRRSLSAHTSATQVRCAAPTCSVNATQLSAPVSSGLLHASIVRLMLDLCVFCVLLSFCD